MCIVCITTSTPFPLENCRRKRIVHSCSLCLNPAGGLQLPLCPLRYLRRWWGGRPRAPDACFFFFFFLRRLALVLSPQMRRLCDTLAPRLMRCILWWMKRMGSYYQTAAIVRVNGDRVEGQRMKIRADRQKQKGRDKMCSQHADRRMSLTARSRVPH